MMESLTVQSLLIHGLIVLFAGILAGFPFWIAIIRKCDKAVIRSWRAAHTTLIAAGTYMLIIFLLSPYLELGSKASAWLVRSLVLSGYGFTFAFILGAITGHRALTPKPYGLSTILFLGHMIGAVGSISAISIILYGLI